MVKHKHKDPQGGLNGHLPPPPHPFRTTNREVWISIKMTINRRLVCLRFLAQHPRKMTASPFYANQDSWKNCWYVSEWRSVKLSLLSFCGVANVFSVSSNLPFLTTSNVWGKHWSISHRLSYKPLLPWTSCTCPGSHQYLHSCIIQAILNMNPHVIWNCCKPFRADVKKESRMIKWDMKSGKLTNLHVHW